MSRKKNSLIKIKKIIICVDNEMEVFNLTQKEKLKCSKEDIKNKCTNILEKIEKMKSKCDNTTIVQQLQSIKTENKTENQNVISPQQFFSYMSSFNLNEYESIDDFDQTGNVLKEFHDQYNIYN